MPKFIKALLILLLLFFIFYGLQEYSDLKDNSKRIEITKTTQESREILLVSEVATGLEVPWALAFLPDGGILVTERGGRVRIINNEGRLQEKPIANLPQVKQTGESGLHGIAIHPDFEKTHYVYVYYTYSAGGEIGLNRVSRFVFDGASLTDVKIVVDKIPGAIFHDGGRIKFGPDGALYITTGDALNPSLAQDKNSLAGKILRIKDPSTSSGQVEVVSYGHRNPQGISWDKDGRLWETEHGQSATDEVNLIEQGKNYGWPIIRGDEQRGGMENPILQSGIDTWAPAGMAYYNGSLYFAGLRGQALYQINTETLQLKEHFKRQFGRIRDVVLGPDNMLYITTSNRDGRGSPSPDDDKILRINPEKLQ